MPAPAGTEVEIRGFREDYLEGATEAREVRDRRGGTVFMAEPAPRLGVLSWSDEVVIGRVEDVIVYDRVTTFSLVVKATRPLRPN